MTTGSLRLDTLVGPEQIRPHLEALADLRIRVFRDWPYLYDGDRDYEAWYLGEFAKSPDAVLVLARDGDDAVGAATGVPLSHEHEDFIAPFRAAGWPVDQVFYDCESILLPAYRGRGLYRRFFDDREAQARALGGFDRIVFCGVVRPDSHPMRPADAQPLDPVWRHFGYRPVEGMVTSFSWKDVGDTEETAKPMQFWVKELETT